MMINSNMTNTKIEDREMVRLLEIERFAIHDGPGIRTVVFFQGCPLHCPWCANPESQTVSAQLFYDVQKCAKCGECVNSCPYDSLSLCDGVLDIDRLACKGCGECVEHCPQSAMKLVGVEMSVDEVMSVILRDKDYYESSGGGVTFSGGEALLQLDCLLELLKRCNAEGISTAIETCGQVPTSSIINVLPYVDLLLFDVKHTDSNKLKQVIGASKELIMDNLRQIAWYDSSKVVIRVPCVAGFNFEDAFFDELFELALGLNIRRVELLPYHILGVEKYRKLGLQYKGNGKSLDVMLLNPIKERGDSLDLHVCFSI